MRREEFRVERCEVRVEGEDEDREEEKMKVVMRSGKGSNMNEARKFSVCMGMMPANFTV